MGAGMDKILPGLFVGSIRDSKDLEQIKKHNITHIVSIHEDAKEGSIQNIEYLCFTASDNASQDIKKFFEDAIDFIHNARLNNGNVLVHCLAGISRSTTLATSYIMTVTEMPWYDSLNAVRAARKGANPNFGFQRQLQNFEFTTRKAVRENLIKKYGHYDHKDDLTHCQTLLEVYRSQQTALTSSANKSNNFQMSYTSIKTYPLAFNAYGLDQEDDEKQSMEKEKGQLNGNKPTNDDEKDQNTEDSENQKDESHLPNEKEKEEMINKIFQ